MEMADYGMYKKGIRMSKKAYWIGRAKKALQNEEPIR